MAAGDAGGSLVNWKMANTHMGNGRGPEEATVAAPRVVVAIETGVVVPERDVLAEGEDFFDPQDTISTASNTEMEDVNGPERLLKPPDTPMADYYDAFEEMSSEVAGQSSSRSIEKELHEMRLNLLMETEKRKQAEEALGSLHNLWQRMSHQLSLVGLVLPSATAAAENIDRASLDVDPVAELGQQVLISQLVGESIVRGCSRAEVELKMEPQINAKNFEIARLWDRLQYYEAANREMSQRNQEAVEMARQQRNRRKRRQKWIWSSVGLTIALGTAAIVWSYLPSSTSYYSEGKSKDAVEIN